MEKLHGELIHEVLFGSKILAPSQIFMLPYNITFQSYGYSHLQFLYTDI